MIRIVYLRFETRWNPPSMEAVTSGLEQALDLGCELVKVRGRPFAYPAMLESVLQFGSDRGVELTIDTSLEDVNPEVASTFCHLPVSVSVHFPKNVVESPDYVTSTRRDLTACLAVSPRNERFDSSAASLLNKGYDLVKVSLSRDSNDSPSEYLTAVERLRSLHSQYGGKVQAMMPWVLLGQSNMSLGRTVCQYAETIGLMIDGTVTCCGTPKNKAGTASVRESTLASIVQTEPLIREMHSVREGSIEGICSKCVFSRYCANQCPAHVYSVTGRFSKSFPDCQWLYDNGVFPQEYVME